MGKLAERLSDARRSGVYRVEATDALEEAVQLNGFALARIDLGGAAVPSSIAAVAASALEFRRDGCVMLFTGFEALVRSKPRALDDLISALRDTAARHQLAEERFFAAFLDPRALLPLDPLYNRRRAALASNAQERSDTINLI
jgi:hypothetical protein